MLNTPYRGQVFVAIVGMGALIGFFVGQDIFGPSTHETEDLRRRAQYVAYRDPKIIEEHKSKLAALNAQKPKQ